MKGHIRPRCYEYIKKKLSVRKVWIRKDELKEVKCGGTVRLKKISDEYVIISSPWVKESSRTVESIEFKEP